MTNKKEILIETLRGSVGCAYIPADGLCIEIEAHVCPATRFFELPELIGDDMINRTERNQNEPAI